MKKHWKSDWLIGLVVMLLCMLAAITDLNRDIELAGYDLGVRFSSTKSANQDVVIIKIDEASLQEKGGWPWPRDILAEATRVIASARPAVIGYVLPLDREQSAHGIEYIRELKELVKKRAGGTYTEVKRLLRKAEIRMDTDQVFATSLYKAGRVVLAIPFLDSNKLKASSLGLPEHIRRYRLKGVIGTKTEKSVLKKWFLPAPILSTEKIYPPIKALARQAGGAGTLYLGVDKSHIRTEPLVIKYGKDYMPSFVLMMATRNQALSTRSIKVDLKSHKISLGGEEIKVDNKLRIYPKFYRGNKGSSAFPEYSILDVLNRKVSKSALRGKTILIGVTAPQHALPQETPIGEVMAPVRVIAHKVSSLLNDELYAVPEWVLPAQLSMLLIIGLYLMFLLPRFRMGTGMALSGLLLIAILNVHFISMVAQSMWLPMMTPLLALVIGHLVLASKKFVDSHLSVIKLELSQANQLLGQSFHSQGKLDQAMEEYRKCIVNTSLLEQMYNLGLDYERKRQFNKAIPVFESIQVHAPNFRDVSERLARNAEVSNAIVLGGSGAASPNGTLVVSNSGMEKPMLGRYQIDKEIGRGAMGMVYLGHDPKIGRTVAIKTLMLSQEFEGDKLVEAKERFFREAETAGRLNHPNIVTIYDVGEDQEMSYIAMDYLKGKDLLGYSKKGTLLPAMEVMSVIMKVADALDYANLQKVVHRDIKPANIIYDKKTGILKVTDFGVACLTDTSKTKTGTILGSPSYMSPEQLAGKRVDGRSDLFSLGVTMYQLLTGELPFVGESLASLMYKIANEKHPDIRMFDPELPACVAKIINKALHKDIELRFQSGEQMLSALRRCKGRFDA
ncbi:MAG: CHASE2 domain-containing protein [Gammaproteobacteria bacterium]|nr:CHASE2 domain-containing protein [Gammaproteobacteria bacterium]